MAIGGRASGPFGSSGVSGESPVPVALLVATLFGAAVSTLVAPTAGAGVGTCPVNVNYDFIVDAWAPSNPPNGVRSPIELRKNGDVCSPGPWTGAVYEWVGVYNNTGSGGGAISQVGWTLTSGKGYCRFWYWDNGSGGNSGVNYSRCGQDGAGDVRLYKVEDTLVSGTHRYSVWDCGTSGWSTCGNSLDQGPTVANLNPNEASAVTESPFGVNCLQIIMGGSNHPTVYGGGLGDIKQQAAYNGAWTSHSLDYRPAACQHYDSGVHNDVKLTTHDDRN